VTEVGGGYVRDQFKVESGEFNSLAIGKEVEARIRRRKIQK
jgi:hypothetical protein